MHKFFGFYYFIRRLQVDFFSVRKFRHVHCWLMFNQTHSSDFGNQKLLYIYSAVKWLKRKTNKPSKIKTKNAKKNSLFSSLVISAAVQKVVWIVAKRLKKCTKRLFEHFLFWWPLVFAWVRVFPNPEIHLQRIRGKNGKKKGNRQFSWHA